MALLQELSLHSASLPGCGGWWALVASRLQTEAAPGARARGGRARAPQSATANQRGPGAAGARTWMLLRLLNATAAGAGWAALGELSPGW